MNRIEERKKRWKRNSEPLKARRAGLRTSATGVGESLLVTLIAALGAMAFLAPSNEANKNKELLEQERAAILLEQEEHEELEDSVWAIINASIQSLPNISESEKELTWKELRKHKSRATSLIKRASKLNELAKITKWEDINLESDEAQEFVGDLYKMIGEAQREVGNQIHDDELKRIGRGFEAAGESLLSKQLRQIKDAEKEIQEAKLEQLLREGLDEVKREKKLERELSKEQKELENTRKNNPAVEKRVRFQLPVQPKTTKSKKPVASTVTVSPALTKPKVIKAPLNASPAPAVVPSPAPNIATATSSNVATAVVNNGNGDSTKTVAPAPSTFRKILNNLHLSQPANEDNVELKEREEVEREREEEENALEGLLSDDAMKDLLKEEEFKAEFEREERENKARKKLEKSRKIGRSGLTLEEIEKINYLTRRISTFERVKKQMFSRDKLISVLRYLEDDPALLPVRRRKLLNRLNPLIVGLASLPKDIKELDPARVMDTDRAIQSIASRWLHSGINWQDSFFGLIQGRDAREFIEKLFGLNIAALTKKGELGRFLRDMTDAADEYKSSPDILNEVTEKLMNTWANKLFLHKDHTLEQRKMLFKALMGSEIAAEFKSSFEAHYGGPGHHTTVYDLFFKSFDNIAFRHFLGESLTEKEDEALKKQLGNFVDRLESARSKRGWNPLSKKTESEKEKEFFEKFYDEKVREAGENFTEAEWRLHWAKIIINLEKTLSYSREKVTELKSSWRETTLLKLFHLDEETILEDNDNLKNIVKAARTHLITSDTYESFIENIIKEFEKFNTNGLDGDVRELVALWIKVLPVIFYREDPEPTTGFFHFW